MSNSEPDVKKFFARIVNSMAIGLLWLFVNSTIGIAYNFAFFEGEPTIGNCIFYGWFIISFILLLLYYKKKWNL